MNTQESTFLGDKLDTLKEFIDEINDSIGNWRDLDDKIDEKTIEEYKKEDAVLKDLAGSLLNVYNQFKR